MTAIHDTPFRGLARPRVEQQPPSPADPVPAAPVVVPDAAPVIVPDTAPVVADGEPVPVEESDDRPRRPRSLGRVDRIELGVAVGVGVCLALCVNVLFDWTHPLTLVVWGLIGFVVAEWLLVRDRLGSVVATDRIMTVVVWSTGAIAGGLLTWMIVYVVGKGLRGLSWSFFTEDLSTVGPLDPGGGALHAIVGTLEQNLIAAAVAIPVAILTAVYLNEIRGRMSGIIRFCVDAMSGLPSIVAGLVVYTVWVSQFGFSGIASAMALVIVMLPITTRTSEEILRTVDNTLREGSYALGAHQWRVIGRVVLPTARSGLITAAILGVARAVGETAPGLLTAFGSARTNWNPIGEPQQNLPVFVFQLLRQPVDLQIQRAWSGALLLVMLVLTLFLIARIVGNLGARRRGGR